jgi:hypothetical protein
MQETALETAPYVAQPTLDDLFATDAETRARCAALR